MLEGSAECFYLYILMHSKVYLVFELLKQTAVSVFRGSIDGFQWVPVVPFVTCLLLASSCYQNVTSSDKVQSS